LCMTTRIEIIAQLDDEITRLERARDFLVATLASAPNELKKTATAIASVRKVKTAVPGPVPTRKRKLPAKAAAPAAAELQSQVVVAPPPPQPKEEPQIKRVPPRRRMERRHLEKPGKSVAALSGSVPTGPVAVSANEARKMQERAVPPPPPPAATELRSEIGSERSLGSLIQAFERRAGLSGLETP
jgi:Mrp family chromosome partitioning ATPase